MSRVDGRNQEETNKHCYSMRIKSAKVRYTRQLEKFLGWIDKSPGNGPRGDCWIWTGPLYKTNPYGYIQIGGKKWRVHKFSWVYHGNKLKKGKILLHSCDMPLCVNPKHLSLGTCKQNSSQMVERNRHSYGEKRYNAVLTDALVIKIKQMWTSGEFEAKIEIAKKLGLAKYHVYGVLAGDKWRHLK